MRRRDAREGNQAAIVLEFPGAANRATKADYARDFAPPAPIEELAVVARERESGPVVLVRVTLREDWSAEVHRSPTPSDVRLVLSGPGTTAAGAPEQSESGAVPTDDRARPSRWLVTLLLAGGLCLIVVGGYFGGGVSLAWRWMSQWGRSTPTRVVSARELGRMADDLGQLCTEAQRTVDRMASETRDQRDALLGAIDDDLARLRDELDALAGEFDRATQSILLFTETAPAEPQGVPSRRDDPAAVSRPSETASDDDEGDGTETVIAPESPSEDGYGSRQAWISRASDGLTPPRDVRHAASAYASAVEEQDGRVSEEAAADTDVAAERESAVPYDVGREMARAGASAEDIQSATGLGRGEVDLLMRIEGLRGSARGAGTDREREV